VATAAPARRLGFKQKRELEALPGRVSALEQELAALHARMAQPDYHRTGAQTLRAERARCDEIAQQLEQLMERWVDLEALETRAAGPG